MNRTKAHFALVPALMLLACGPQRASDDRGGSEPTPSPTAQTRSGGEAPAPAPAGDLATPPPTSTTGTAASLVPVLTPDAERGVKGARNVLLGFARAIEHKQFDKARGLLSPADRRKWSSSEFAALFADLDRPTVAVPEGTMEGAAGSSYYTAPVTVTGSDKDGRPVRIEGKAVLRRVNDVEGATPEQLRWHFETLTLDWTH